MRTAVHNADPLPVSQAIADFHRWRDNHRRPPSGV